MINILTVNERFQDFKDVEQMCSELSLEIEGEYHMHVLTKKVEHRKSYGPFMSLVPIRVVRCPIRKMQIFRPAISRLIGTVVFIDSKKYKDIKGSTIRRFCRFKKGTPSVEDGIIYLPEASAEKSLELWTTYKQEPKRNIDFYQYVKKNLKG